MIEDVTVRSGASRRGARWRVKAALRLLASATMATMAALMTMSGCRGGADQNRSLAAERPSPGASEAAQRAAGGSSGASAGSSAQAASGSSAASGSNAASAGSAAGARSPAGSSSIAAAAPRLVDATLSCEAVEFPLSLPIAEASGAVVTTIDGAAAMMVIADSGHTGDYLLVDPQSGAVRERGKLPLGDKGDDLEGLAFRNGRFYAITSSGWLRAWKRKGPPQAGFELVSGPTPIGALAPAAEAMSCELARVNCGKNYEGLCLAPSGGAAGECVGMAASKKAGRLYCIVEGAKGQLSIDPTRSIAVSKPEALADCNIDGEALWAGANFFDFNRVWRITGWRDPAPVAGASPVRIEELGAIGGGFCEGMAASGETLFRLSDTQGSPSLISKFRCRPPTK